MISMQPNISQIPEEYRKRWGIETGYACIGKFRPRTCSRNHSIRFLYFLYPLILFNAWIIANCMLRNNYSINNTNPIITIEILKCIFGIIIVDSFRKVTSEYYLEDVSQLLSQVLIVLTASMFTGQSLECTPNNMTCVLYAQDNMDTPNIGILYLHANSSILPCIVRLLS